MGGLGEFGALFNPGMRHELEERRAKQMLREEEGSARKGRLGIDLESGVAVIATRRDRDDDAVDPDETDGDRQVREPDETEAGGDETGGAGSGGEPAGGGGASDGTRSGGEPPGSSVAARQPRPGTAVPSGKARRAAGGSSPRKPR